MNAAEVAERVELKYCERCGGLWLRHDQEGAVCGTCQREMAAEPVFSAGGKEYA